MLNSFIIHAQGLSDWTDLTGHKNSCIVDGVPTLKCLEVVYTNILFMASALVMLVLFVMFVIGAFNYLTSFGDPAKVKKAQGTLRYAVLGLVLFLSSFLILKTIDVLFLGNCGKIFRFEIGSDSNQQGQAPCPNP